MQTWVGYVLTFLGGGAVGLVPYLLAPKVDRDKRQDDRDAPIRQHKLEALKAAEEDLKAAIRYVSGMSGLPPTMTSKVDRPLVAGKVASHVGSVAAYASSKGNAYIVASQALDEWARTGDDALVIPLLQAAVTHVTTAIDDL